VYYLFRLFILVGCLNLDIILAEPAQKADVDKYNLIIINITSIKKFVKFKFNFLKINLKNA